VYPQLSRLSSLLSPSFGLPAPCLPAAPAFEGRSQYHAAVIRFAVVAVLAMLASSGCLENLNQQKYFDTLEAAAPTLAQRVDRHRDRIEQELGAELGRHAPTPATHIGYWGASWDLVRRVTDGEQLFMRGRMFHAEGPASTYYLAFTVADDGSVEILDAQVNAVRRGPR